MKERPILFNGPMVRAVLDGSKTQTRRPVRDTGLYAIDADIHGETVAARELAALATRCPYGAPGDRLWVRETWARPTTLDPGPVFYRADYPACVPHGYANVPPADAITWKPSIHMFRRDSRITLEITGVRVERLNSISEADARSEGITDGGCLNCGNPEPCGCDFPTPSARDSFVRLWESTGGDWHANPWVWVIEFRRVTP